MGVNRENNDSSQPQVSQPAAAFEAAFQQQDQSKYQGGNTMSNNTNAFAAGAAGLNSRLRRPMAKSNLGESVAQYRTAFAKLAEEAELQESGYRLLVLDGQQALTALSAVICVLEMSVGGKPKAIAHTMILESSGPRLMPREIKIGGNSVERIVVPSDVYDGKFVEAVVTLVRQSSGLVDLEVVDAGSSVVPSELSPEDLVRLRRILQNATSACFTRANMISGGALEESFNASWLTSKDRLVARVDYSPLPSETMAGLPRRSDITVELVGQIAGNDGAQVEQSISLCKLTAFVDLIYKAPEQQGMMGFGSLPGFAQAPMPGATQHYTPRIVVTGVSTELNATTLETQLMGLSLLALLARGNAYLGAFTAMPYNSGGVDLRDIGAVGFEINLTGDANAKPAKIDTKAESFSAMHMQQLLAMAIRTNSIVFSIDVDESGDESWINMALAVAAGAAGTAAGQSDATAALVEAAQRLTCGKFANFYKGDRLAISDDNRIHTGYYDHPNGTRQDLRDLDYLAMLNLLGDRDMRAVVEYASTFDDVQVPVEIRLEKRARILRLALGDTVKVKGYARRVTLNPEFIFALAEGLAAAGLSIQPQNMIASNATGQRGQATALQFATNGMQQQSNLFNFTQPAFGQGYQSQMGQAFSFWNR